MQTNFSDTLISQIVNDANFIYKDGKYISEAYDVAILIDKDVVILTSLDNKYILDNLSGRTA